MAKQVMIVDDALFMRSMLRDIFEAAGWQVVAEAENGQQAVELFAQHQPDLVTMDIVMPEMSGLDAMQKILSDYPEAKVVMCSALGQESMVMEAIKAGAKDFIVKPFQDEQVIDVVDRVCAA
ncbi:two-component system, chemotaxis family, response regulator CheY [Malonomonas rubra DSM 5091]|uniref:Two-component system, chemotaxis family, response regulator CheY n=1 Tax=Malonomonas rubra DSM 5091 TaxID=1122189 RepID=A0A1M6JXT8_MALRU|nr:response regulator [Malonomonas rubra]SHJ51509.1 two-component system, chemotaxis family, response regulator CheY [Malonomonas rubra DSM 5091]